MIGMSYIHVLASWLGGILMTDHMSLYTYVYSCVFCSSWQASETPTGNSIEIFIA